jgi:hypothetical protein
MSSERIFKVGHIRIRDGLYVVPIFLEHVTVVFRVKLYKDTTMDIHRPKDVYFIDKDTYDHIVATVIGSVRRHVNGLEVE